jgi:hypothetical protein
MSYQGPMLIREPELRWPVVLLAGLATALVVLLTAGVISLALARPAAPPATPPHLVGALMEVTALSVERTRLRAGEV